MAFKLPELNYSYDALEPHIDAKTMEIHHSKHHNGYTNNLNTAISGTEMENMTIEEICKNENLSSAVRNNGGGYYNHCLFWDIISPNGGGAPSEKLLQQLSQVLAALKTSKMNFRKPQVLDLLQDGHGYAVMMEN